MKKVCYVAVTEVLEDPHKGSESVFKELGDDWIPHCVRDKKSFLNQGFSNVDSAFKFYEDYDHMCGFIVRRSSEKKDKAGKLQQKKILFIFKR